MAQMMLQFGSLKQSGAHRVPGFNYAKSSENPFSSLWVRQSQRAPPTSGMYLQRVDNHEMKWKHANTGHERHSPCPQIFFCLIVALDFLTRLAARRPSANVQMKKLSIGQKAKHANTDQETSFTPRGTQHVQSTLYTPNAPHEISATRVPNRQIPWWLIYKKYLACPTPHDLLCWNTETLLSSQIKSESCLNSSELGAWCSLCQLLLQSRPN